MVKICKNCLIEKEISDFRKKVIKNKEYYANKCKECIYDEQNKERKTQEFRSKERQNYAKNKDKINARRRSKYIPKQRKLKQSKEERYKKQREWIKNNPDKRRAYIKKYHSSHKEEEKLYYINNRKKIILRTKSWRSKNRSRINAALKIKRKNPIIKLRHKISSLVRQYIDGIKKGSILQYLQYTIQELKDHLEKQFEPWMNWDNHGNYRIESWDDNVQSTWTWQIDHIIPQSDLPYASMEDENFKKCWALSNLRPLSAKQNILDGTGRKRHKGK